MKPSGKTARRLLFVPNTQRSHSSDPSIRHAGIKREKIFMGPPIMLQSFLGIGCTFFLWGEVIPGLLFHVTNSANESSKPNSKARFRTRLNQTGAKLTLAFFGCACPREHISTPVAEARKKWLLVDTWMDWQLEFFRMCKEGGCARRGHEITFENTCSGWLSGYHQRRPLLA